MNTLSINKSLAKYTSLPRNQIRRHLTDFAKRIGVCDLILDLGCGLDMPYRDLFNSKSYFGIDLFEPAHIKGDIIHLPILSSRSSIVLLTEVLEHVPDPKCALREIARILKPGGYLILTVPLLWGEHDYIDYQRWTETGLRRLLTDSGFEILECKKRGGIFSSVGCALSNIPHQVFGSFNSQRSWISKILYLASMPIALLIPWIFAPLDILDRRKQFVVGFSLLSKKIV